MRKVENLDIEKSYINILKDIHAHDISYSFAKVNKLDLTPNEKEVLKICLVTRFTGIKSHHISMLRQINPYKLGGKNSTYGVCLSNWMAKQDKTTFNTAVKMFGAILDSGTEYTTIYRLIRFSEHTKHCEIFTERVYEALNFYEPLFRQIYNLNPNCIMICETCGSEIDYDGKTPIAFSCDSCRSKVKRGQKTKEAIMSMQAKEVARRINPRLADEVE